MKNKILFAFLFLSLFLLASAVKAITVIENPNMDSWLQSWSGDTTHGTDTELNNLWNPAGSQYAHSVLNFTVDIPKGSIINKANVSCIGSYTITPSNNKYNISEISDDWQEATVDWNNFAGHYNASTTSQNITAIDDSGRLDFTVTDIVQKWVNGENIYGFYITPYVNSGDIAMAQCWSREKGDGYIPTLTIDYTPPYISVIFNYNTVNFGSVIVGATNVPALNILDGVYNVTVDTNAHYQVSASGTFFYDGSGHNFGITALRMDVATNSTDLSYGEGTYIDTFPSVMWDQGQSTDTINYHGFWFDYVPNVFGGNYTSTVSITYENV
jgi:hypothetical protein